MGFPLTFVRLPTGVHPAVGAGITSKYPAELFAFRFTMLRWTISRSARACPFASFPRPNPISLVAKSYKSSSYHVPSARVADSNCQALFACPLATPFASVLETEGPQLPVVVLDPYSEAVWILQDPVAPTLIEDRLRVPGIMLRPEDQCVRCNSRAMNAQFHQFSFQSHLDTEQSALSRYRV